MRNKLKITSKSTTYGVTIDHTQYRITTTRYTWKKRGSQWSACVSIYRNNDWDVVAHRTRNGTEAEALDNGIDVVEGHSKYLKTKV